MCAGVLSYILFCFFFKQKTAYEMRISDWSSDVCSSDLAGAAGDLRLLLIGIVARHRLEVLAQELVVMEVALHELALIAARLVQLGRASCRERVCQYV